MCESGLSSTHAGFWIVFETIWSYHTPKRLTIWICHSGIVRCDNGKPMSQKKPVFHCGTTALPRLPLREWPRSTMNWMASMRGVTTERESLERMSWSNVEVQANLNRRHFNAPMWLCPWFGVSRRDVMGAYLVIIYVPVRTVPSHRPLTRRRDSFLSLSAINCTLRYLVITWGISST